MGSTKGAGKPDSASGGGALAELSSRLSNAVAEVAPGVVAIHARRRIPSSGIVWRDGVVVSASHTVRHDGEVSITLANGESVMAAVIGRDAATDLVALRIEGSGPGAAAKAAAKADADAARVGAFVLAVGRPGRGVSASFGIVSAIAEGWRSAQGTRIERLLRLDLGVYDGFSGGPLVAASGGVIGVNNSALARGAPATLPMSVVDRVLDELLSRGHVHRPFIGVAVHPVELGSARVRRQQLSHSSGLVVLSLAEGAPADAAGILVGDVLMEAGAQTLARPADLLDALSAVAPGESVSFTVLRGDTLSHVDVSPSDRDAEGGVE